MLFEESEPVERLEKCPRPTVHLDHGMQSGVGDKIADQKARGEEAKRQREKKDLQAREREEWHKQKEQKKWDEVKQAAIGQPSPSKVQAKTWPSLARAPVGQPTPTPPPTAQQLAGLAQTFQDEDVTANDLALRQQA